MPGAELTGATGALSAATKIRPLLSSASALPAAAASAADTQAMRRVRAQVRGIRMAFSCSGFQRSGFQRVRDTNHTTNHW
ncbi:hypothetical protein D3C72_1722440 [compost metagenome]